MALKRAAPKGKSTSKAKPAARPPARKPKPAPESAAVKLLGQLPAIDARLRQAYLALFTDAQCTALGERTVARQVLAEALTWLPALHRGLQDGAVGGYSARRLAFLAGLVVALEDELAAAGGSGARASTLTWARATCLDLSARLGLVSGGREDLQEHVRRRGGHDGSIHQVRDALTGLIELATRWRRDPLLELLADDADLSTARLGGAYNALEALARTDEVLREVVTFGADSPGVNAIEGRILHELRVAQLAFQRARAAGSRVPALVPGPSLKKAFPGVAA